jgi:hypothetical protein
MGILSGKCGPCGPRWLVVVREQAGPAVNGLSGIGACPPGPGPGRIGVPRCDGKTIPRSSKKVKHALGTRPRPPYLRGIVPRGGMRSTVDAGGADSDNARCSVPVTVDFRPAIGAPGASMATPETLTSAIQRREQRLRASWQEDGADTELLRIAFRRYRAFFDQLTKV